MSKKICRKKEKDWIFRSLAKVNNWQTRYATEKKKSVPNRLYLQALLNEGDYIDKISHKLSTKLNKCRKSFTPSERKKISEILFQSLSQTLEY